MVQDYCYCTLYSSKRFVSVLWPMNSIYSAEDWAVDQGNVKYSTALKATDLSNAVPFCDAFWSNVNSAILLPIPIETFFDSFWVDLVFSIELYRTSRIK